MKCTVCDIGGSDSVVGVKRPCDWVANGHGVGTGTKREDKVCSCVTYWQRVLGIQVV